MMNMMDAKMKGKISTGNVIFIKSSKFMIVSKTNLSTLLSIYIACDK